MHCTIIVPATSAEYQMLDMAFRPVFLVSLWVGGGRVTYICTLCRGRA